ncbi:helix-turn-helix domain-containing protein [Paenibacillus daejeonensis]|uniref:helix-turn-helix domain-containing protein n=1 Tax=Paenibacillus daejeonensis TaxID=135193 RepID=UPI00035DBB69|nr:helix-turn-helix domain-containing protein [Paenibacillus daejeonensis]
MIRPHRRLELTPFNEQSLPLFAESIGHNTTQEPISRPAGFPYYHWIQTTAGEGVIRFEGNSIELTPSSGVLLLPHVPHSYEATSDVWQTMYLTFDGPMALPLLQSLDMERSAYYRWESDMPWRMEKLLEKLEQAEDVFGLTATSEVYRFLVTLSKYGKPQGSVAFSLQLEQLRPVIAAMESQLDDPGLGLTELAMQLGLSSRRLGELFRRAFGLAPYAYLLNLRIRKAKELLIRDRELTVSTIATQVGFRDPSHFVATFRKRTGLTPQQFRMLN